MANAPNATASERRQAAPLWVWAAVIAIVGIASLVWYIRVGQQQGFESPELNQHYLRELAKFYELRRGRDTPAWVIAIGRSDLDYALPEIDPYRKTKREGFTAQQPLLLQKIILFSGMLADFERLLPPIVNVKPQLILIDYDLLFDDATAFRNANYTLDYLRAELTGKEKFRPHGGSFPEYIDRDSSRCKQSKYRNPEQIVNLVQRLLHLQNLKQTRRSDGVSAKRADIFFAEAAKRGVKLAAVRMPVHPELERQRSALNLIDERAEAAKIQHWQERYGLQLVRLPDDWPAELFCDATHMTLAGKEKFWREIEPLLAGLLGRAP